ncbi:MAG: serine hydrolase domain-containing protein [Nocardioides sp.]
MSDLDQVLEELPALAEELRAQHGIPGLAVGVCDASDVLWAGGLGTTDGPSDRSVDLDTRFSVQSTSKLVTATGVLLGVRDGLVDLDAPILDHLPDFTVGSVFESRPERLMTLRHLLTHTAGFTHEAPLGGNYDVRPHAFAEHVASIRDTWLRFPVGHHHEYSNLGIDLAGHLLAQAAGTSFAHFLRTRMFDPLGMTRSTFDFDDVEDDPNAARGHSKAFAEAGADLPRRVPMIPAGGLYTSLGDVLRLLQLHLSDGAPLLDPTLYAEHTAFPRLSPEQDEGYGLCLYVDHWAPGVEVRHHGGAGYGFLCQVFWLPELGLGGAVLTSSVDHNVQNDLAEALCLRLARASGVTQAPPPSEVPADASPLPPSAAGRYLGRLGDLVELRDEEVPGHRLLPDQHDRTRYLLERRTGEVRYKLHVDGVPASTLPVALLGEYRSHVDGVPIGRYRLRQSASGAVLEQPRAGSWDDPLSLQLESLGDGRFLSATGEILDTTGGAVTYANIPLTRSSETSDVVAGDTTS